MATGKFLPPQLNPLFTRLIQSIFYLVMYFGYQIKLKASDRDLALLKDIDDKRVIYLPNHSNLDDGLVMFLFSARLGQLFYYIVAYEAFRGLIGKLMPKVGCYSIRRGMGDRASIVQTLKIIQQPQSKLVIFPEGGCSYQNDTVIPFRSGGIELAFKALEKLAKQGTVPDLYLVPTSIKYWYHGDRDLQIEQSLEELETALNLERKQNDFYLRLRNISAKILNNLEAEYKITPKPDEDWNQRIKILKQQLLQYCEQQLNITPATQLPNRERVYKIQALLEDLQQSGLESNIDYQHLELTTVRLLNFDAIYDGYVADKPTKERFIATIDRLEREVFNIPRPKPKGIREVEVKIAPPINLKDYWQNNQNERAIAVKELTRIVQQQVQANLN